MRAAPRSGGARASRRGAAAGLALAAGLSALPATAAPEARLLRVDPRASFESGSPILTTVVQVTENKRLSEAVADCAGLTGNAQFDCMSPKLERDFALYTPFPFPKENAIFTVAVDGADSPAQLVDAASWGASQQQPGVGTAWLILIDADKRIGNGLADAREIASRFVQAMGPNDIVNVMFFNDRQVVKDSRWLPAADRAKATQFIGSVPEAFPASGRNRSLLTIIKNAATDGFKSLGNVGETVKIPLHQAMVVLSTGFGGADALTNGAGGLQLSTYMSNGRFPEENTALPKTPVPVVSIFLPPIAYDEFKQASFDFMQNIANPDIGGFFTIVRGDGAGRAPDIVKAVRTRFSKMHLVRWKVSCVAPTITQSFRLNFNNVKPAILGDNSFKDVPVGIDPTTWPLDIDLQRTTEAAGRDPVHPGGKFKVYGNFCWGGDKSRAEVYFLPAGQAAPAALQGASIEAAKKLQQQLISQGMKGSSVEANQTYAEFLAPDKEKLLHGAGSAAVVRMVVYDNAAHRASGATADSILTLKAAPAPFPVLWVLGGAAGATLLALIGVIALRSGGNKRKGGSAPVAPPTGYTGPAPGMVPLPPMPGPAAPGYGLTGGVPAHPTPPPNPYATPASRATLQGPAGTFTIVPGVEMRAGRDGMQCTVLLSEPRVSSVHAALKVEGGQLLVRDENSNNGTLVNNSRIPPGTWTPVPNGSLLRFGPVEFSVRLD